MINKDRIVPVTATDLLTLLGTASRVPNNLTKLEATAPGQFTVAAASSYGYLANEPVEFLNFGEDVSADVVYFIPAYNFAGMAVNGTVAEIADVDADGRTLYSATLATGTITVAKVGF